MPAEEVAALLREGEGHPMRLTDIAMSVDIRFYLRQWEGAYQLEWQGGDAVVVRFEREQDLKGDQEPSCLGCLAASRPACLPIRPLWLGRMSACCAIGRLQSPPLPKKPGSGSYPPALSKPIPFPPSPCSSSQCVCRGAGRVGRRHPGAV